MVTARQHEMLLTDLIDLLTIAQIKESLFSGEASLAATGDLDRASADVSEILRARNVEPSGRIIRLVMLLSETNLQVWLNKDQMAVEPER